MCVGTIAACCASSAAVSVRWHTHERAMPFPAWLSRSYCTAPARSPDHLKGPHRRWGQCRNAGKLRGPPHRRAAEDRSSCRPRGRVLCPRCREAVSGKLQNRAVIEMTLATATSALESRFDRFLYAAVREDPDGTPLTMLSVLARLDVDPWKEAERFAQLPGEAAARALAILISALPNSSATPSDSETIAARLITLLPRRSEQALAPRRDASGGPHVNRIPNRATIVAQAVLCLIVLALLLVSQCLAVRHLAPQPAKGPRAAPAMVGPAPAARPGPDASRAAASSASSKAAGASPIGRRYSSATPR